MSTNRPDSDDDELDGLDASGLTYADAVVELEAILEELEDDRIDVDTLAERVKRSAVLLRFCRARITSAKLEIDQVVADLEAFDDLLDVAATRDLDG